MYEYDEQYDDYEAWSDSEEFYVEPDAEWYREEKDIDKTIRNEDIPW